MLTTMSFAADYPVLWTENVNINSLSEIPQLLTKESTTSVNYISDKGQRAVANSCARYFELTKQGYYPENNKEISGESFFKMTCDPLNDLLHAKPAKQSYLRSFDIQKDYGLLPAAVVFPSLGESSDTKDNVKAAYPDVFVQTKMASKIAIDLVSKKAAMKSHVDILAWGDFNNDGYDDMLIFVANYVLQGTYHSYTTYILTKKSSDGAIEVIN